MSDDEEYIEEHDCDDHRFGVEIPTIYDGVLYWECTRCGRTWHRWIKGTPQYEAAKPYVTEAA